MKKGLHKIIVVVGPTASGKSDLAVELARRFDGEVVSADSRQVYRGLDVGSGKITKREMRGVPHHLLDVASPRRVYTVAHYERDALRAIENILARECVPIVAGGTGLYVSVVLGDISIPELSPDSALRKKLEKKSPQELYARLFRLDRDRAQTIDPHNKRRLVRAIEIALSLGSVPKRKRTKRFDPLIIGIQIDKDALAERICKRIISRLQKGMVAEAWRLHAQGLSYKRMEALGLEYRYLARLLQKKITREAFVEQLGTEINKYAKRQMTWFKRDPRIIWIKRTKKEKRGAFELARQFIGIDN